MEQLGATTRVAFDKTGTLTEGTPRLTGITVLPGTGLSERDALALAAAAEAPSEHPLGRAVTAAARGGGLTLARAHEFSAAPGRGVSALVSGRRIEVGSPARLLAGTPADAAAAVVTQTEESGQTAAVVRVDGTVAAVLAIADRTRPAAASAVARITEVTGAAPVLLTGDNQRAATRLAGQVGISDVRAGLLPQDKVSAVNDLQARGARVLLVGDGINDAPALAAAATGAAMGRAGSDLALDTADAVIMRDDLATVPAVITLSRRARRVVTANLAIAAVIITALVTWDLAGHLPLPLGVLGHEGSTVIVGLNGLRLLRARAWRKAACLSPSPDGRRAALGAAKEVGAPLQRQAGVPERRAGELHGRRPRVLGGPHVLPVEDELAQVLVPAGSGRGERGVRARSAAAPRGAVRARAGRVPPPACRAPAYGHATCRT
jgi:cation transport ATPase